MLVTRLQVTGHLPSDAVDEVISAVMQREQLGSTGIGRGLAVPHAKHLSVSRLTGTIGYAANGLEFDALDGKPVHTIVLLLSPPDRPGEHLRALEKISRLMRTPAE